MSNESIQKLFFEEMELLKQRLEINKRLRDVRKEKNEVFIQYTLDLTNAKEGGANG
jgi:hypothetical protein